jgi:hypothetical protein
MRSRFPNGTSTEIGGVEKTVTGNATIAAVAATDVAAAAGAAPTAEEYLTVVTLLNETKAQLNSVIATLKTAGIIL